MRRIVRQRARCLAAMPPQQLPAITQPPELCAPVDVESPQQTGDIGFWNACLFCSDPGISCPLDGIFKGFQP